MSSKTYFDTYNIFNITKEDDTELDIGLLSESLILNDNIIININNPKTSIEKLITRCGERNLLNLLKKGTVSFNYDFMPFRLSELRDEQNKICRLILEDYNEDVDIEKDVVEALKKTVKNKKKLKIIKNDILDNCKLTKFNNINTNEMNKFICENLNNNKVIYAILKANKPYHFELEYFQKLEYEIECKEGSFYINLPSSEKQNLNSNKGVFGGAFLPSIMRSYVSIISAKSNSCDNLWGSKSTEALFEANSATKIRNNNSKNYRTLVEIEGCPNIVEKVNNNEMNFDKVLAIRKKSKKLRNLLDNFKYEDDSEKSIKEYFKTVREEDKFLNNLPMKTIRLLFGCAYIPYSIFDTYLLPDVKDDLFKTVKISKILK